MGRRENACHLCEAARPAVAVNAEPQGSVTKIRSLAETKTLLKCMIEGDKSMISSTLQNWPLHTLPYRNPDALMRLNKMIVRARYCVGRA
jgi:hypothetical protein